MKKLPILWLLAIAALSGCAPLQLQPAPGAQRVAAEPLAATDKDAGVQVTVQPEAWRGYPEHLDRKLTPMKVTIENDSDHPLRICYEDLILEAANNIQYVPLPPVDIRGQVTERADTPIYLPRYAFIPGFVHRGFFVAPWYSGYYAGLTPWDYPWAFNPAYYDIYYPRWSVDLPTKDMIAQAIPEGVVEPGGEISGFLYFPPLDRDVQHVTFKANLSTARQHKLVAALRVPFEAG